MKTDIQKLEALAKAATQGEWQHFRHGVIKGGPVVQFTNGSSQVQIVMTTGAEWMRPDEQGANADFIAAANPAAVLELIAEIERLQRFESAYKELSDKTDWVQENAHWSELGMHRADVLRKRCDDLTSHCQAQADEIVRLQASAALIELLPELDEALEDLEIHGQHSDQGYRNLKDWYRKVALACKAIDTAMAQEQQP